MIGAGGGGHGASAATFGPCRDGKMTGAVDGGRARWKDSESMCGERLETTSSLAAETAGSIASSRIRSDTASHIKTL